MVSFKQIKDVNEAGWVLFHSKNCGYCVAIKKNVGPLKWASMNKKECSNGGCPSVIKGYPTWYNTSTGETWDGVGVFR